MIKNWTVKTKQIKKGSDGFINHVNYLQDTARASHQYTDITILNDAAASILQSVEDRAQYRADHKLTGARYVKNYATSFVLSLPRNINQPTKNDWHNIIHFIITRIAKQNDIDREHLKKHCHAVLHDESKSIDKHSHVHLLVSNVIDNQVIKSFTQYRTTHLIKMTFNRAVELAVKESNLKYQPKNTNVRDKPLFAARSEKALLTMKLFRRFEKHAKNWLKSVLKTFQRQQQEQLAQQTAAHFDNFDLVAENLLADEVFNDLENIEQEVQISKTAQTTPYTKRKRRRRKRKD